MKFWRVFRIFATVAKPLLKLVGVKESSVAGKVAEGAAIVDAAVGKDREAQKRP